MLAARIITAVFFGGALTVAVLFLPTPLASAVLGLLWLAGAWEWAGFAALKDQSRVLYTVALALCMAVVWWNPAARAVGWLLPVALGWWALALVAVMTYPHRFGAATVAAAGFVVLVPSFALLARLHGVPAGPPLAFSLLCIIWSADVGAYASGRIFGRHKLAPAVSPGKTWEGVAGGLLAAAAAAAAAASWLDVALVGMVVLGIVTAIVSVLGDLTQSMFKRNAGLKDSGSWLPGHGGVLDRIDSLTAAVPVFVLGLSVLRLAA